MVATYNREAAGAIFDVPAWLICRCLLPPIEFNNIEHYSGII
jgi:hypothetical protein